MLLFFPFSLFIAVLQLIIGSRTVASVLSAAHGFQGTCDASSLPSRKSVSLVGNRDVTPRRPPLRENDAFSARFIPLKPDTDRDGSEAAGNSRL